MAKNSLPARLLKGKTLVGALLALLLVVTGVVVAVAMRPITPPAPTIDIEAIKARDAAKAAEKAAAIEAERVAGLLPITFPGDRPLRVMLSGDSLSQGLYSSTKDTAFRSLVRAELEKHGPVEWTGIHIPGAKVTDIASKESPAVHNDLSIVELGTNDSFRQVPVHEFAAQYAAYLDRLKAESPAVQFLCLGAWNKRTETNMQYEQAIETTCEERGGKFAPLMDIHERAESAGPAGVNTWSGVSDAGHPNDAGHRAIADLVLARLPNLVPASESLADR